MRRTLGLALTVPCLLGFHLHRVLTFEPHHPDDYGYCPVWVCSRCGATEMF